jgi:hypothetical protein
LRYKIFVRESDEMKDCEERELQAHERVGDGEAELLRWESSCEVMTN